MKRRSFLAQQLVSYALMCTLGFVGSVFFWHVLTILSSGVSYEWPTVVATGLGIPTAVKIMDLIVLVFIRDDNATADAEELDRIPRRP